MLPALWSGDSVSVQRANLGDVRPGEVVVYARNRQFVAHRYVRRMLGVDDVMMVTRGDACLEDDMPVSPEEFLGVVACVARVGSERSWKSIGKAFRGPIRLIRSSDLARGLVRRALGLLARGIVVTLALRHGQ
jgi:hypothetical protein